MQKMEAFGKWGCSISNGRIVYVCVAMSCNTAEERA